MRRRVWGWMAWGAFLFQGGFAVAQNTLETLEQELKEAKQQHDDVSTKVLSNFFSQIDAAMASPDAAIALYKQAGGVMPELAPVVSAHENETVTEKDTRLALDQGNLSRLGSALQLHCGLMHYAALFITKPDQKGLQDEWVAWLKSSATIYPQLIVTAGGSDQTPQPSRRRKDRQDGAPGTGRQAPFNPSDVKGKAMRDSIIGKFLGFKSWGDKEQGNWAVQDLPKLYRTTVLDPLRASPTSATLAAWDVYIAMANADETDNDRWNQVVYPPLQFDRACDDYAVAPGTEKLEGLMNLIKANPTYPKVDDWISRAGKLLEDYSAHHGGKTASGSNAATTPSAPDGNPNVIVTTSTQGDMTVITTHTNSAPVTNAPSAH